MQVIGGGFSGLSLAYFLNLEGHAVRLVEEKPRCGGILQTIRTKYGMAERAANALLSNALVEEVARDIGVELTPTKASAKKRFIFHGGKMRRWPLGFVATCRFLFLTAPRFFLQRSFFHPRAGESILAWGQRCLGYEATKFLLVPGLTGVYAGDAKILSASLILGKLFRKGLPRGKMRGSVAPLKGMGDWGEALESTLRARGVEFSAEFEPGVKTIVALPPHRAEEFLREKAPLLASALAQIEMLPVVSVTCFFSKEEMGIEGFGCLFPRSENLRVLGILANDKIFPARVSQGFQSETWILGGATDREILALSDEALVDLIQEERRKIFGMHAPLLHHEISRWEKAIPHYSLALESAHPMLVKTENNFSLFGTYLGDLGLARVQHNARELSLHIK